MRFSLVKTALAASAIALTAVFIVAIVIFLKETEKAPPAGPKASPYPLNITGLEYHAYEQGRLVGRVKAQSFKIRPRKCWAFNIRPLNEAVLTNVTIDLYLYEDDTSTGVVDLEMLLPAGFDDRHQGNKEMGLITRGTIEGLRLTISGEKGPLLVVGAREASIDFRKNRARLKDATLEDGASESRITAKRIIWDNREEVFRIPAEYVMLNAGGLTGGKGIAVDMKGSMRPLKGGVP